MSVKVDALAFSFAGDKYLGRPYSEMDCQAFVERCMRDCGLHEDLPGSNAWYRQVMRNGWVGSPEECLREFGEIPKGALLFILKHDGKEPEKYKPDGIGNASHIGIKTGRNDGAINSSSSRGCVATSKFKDKTIPNGGWNRVGLYDKFDYGKSINWILDHEGGEPPEGEVVQLQAKVTAPTGATVNLRKTKNGDLLDRVPVGSTIMVVDYGPEWCKVVFAGMTGWMMTKFIDFEGQVLPGDEQPADPSQTDIEDDEDFTPADGQAEETITFTMDLQAAANAYPFLRALCDNIEKKVGRG